MCPSDDHGAMILEKEICESLRERKGDASALRFLSLRVIATADVAHDDQIWRPAQMLSCPALHPRDTTLLEHITHRRIDILIGASYLQPQLLEHTGEGAHPRTGDTDEMNTLDLLR